VEGNKSHSDHEWGIGLHLPGMCLSNPKIDQFLKLSGSRPPFCLKLGPILLGQAPRKAGHHTDHIVGHMATRSDRGLGQETPLLIQVCGTWSGIATTGIQAIGFIGDKDEDVS